MNYRFLLGLLAATVFPAAASAFNFSISPLQGVTFTSATSLQFGPDHRLYVSQVDGQIKALTIQRLGPNNYQVTATETINLVRDIPNYNDDGTRNTTLTTRQVTGLLVVGTASNPILYVTSSDPRIGGGSGGANDLNLDTNSGIISRLTRSGGVWSKVDLVRGLPRSEENHAPNGMQLDAATNTLYLAQGGNTNAGGPSNNFAFMCETALAAAILSIDLDVINAMTVKTDAYGQKYLYNLPTVDDPNPARAHNPDGSDVNDPFGGNDGLNQARLVDGGPVQVHSPGWRNPYDLVITRTPGRAGRMYAWDNGPNNGWGGYPQNEGPSGTVTNQYVEGEPGSVNNRDNLHLVTPGFYAGHPNPIRANPAGAGWFHFDATQPEGAQKIFSTSPTTDWPPVPLAMANPVEGDYRSPGVADGALLTYPASTNGLVEYIANNFSGEMQGNLISASYDGKLLRIALNEAGTAVTNGVEVLATGFGGLPLDLTAPDPGHGADFVGTIWVCHYAPAKISVLEPEDFDSPGSSTCTGIDSFDVDEDGDGYSNADEIRNNSDPCSAAIRPPDVDEDQVSDLLDPDDDNDGIPDTQDPFPLDLTNGRSVPLPLRYELFNETGIGFFGVGMTGLMMNRGEDYLPLISFDNAIAGGTSGLFTLAEVGSGSARGSLNTQKDAYQFGFNSDEFTTAYVISSRLGGPFFAGNPTGQQTQGIYLGSGDQDNYVSLALHANSGAGGLEVIHENDGAIVFEQMYPLSGLTELSTIDFFFAVDPIAATVQPGYRIAEGDPITFLGDPISVSGDVLLAVMGADPLAIGLFANTGASGTPTFSATWDYFDIAPVADTAIAKFTIDPPVTDMATASTYTNGAFKIQNSSTGGQHIQAVKVDLSTAKFPDMVYDPEGTAGDPDHKAFMPNVFQGGVSGASGTNTKPHNGVNGADGYDQLDITFNAFPPGGLFTFSIDVDPTSVKGVTAPGQNHSASVSGLELIGSTVEIFFSDGSVHRTRLGRLEGTLDASYGWLRSTKPPKPGLSIPGKSTPLTTGEAETVRVTGPAGFNVTLATIEGALYTGGVPGGGYDLDPYEANTAIKITEATGVIPASGYLDFTVTPTKTNADGGYNYITAVLSDGANVKGPVSDQLTLYFDPSVAGDTEPPTAPGTLSFTSVTANSITINWTAATDNVGVTGYRVSRNGALVTTVTGLSYTDSSLFPATVYSYSVVAIDAAGNVSPASTANVSTASSGGTGTTLRVNAGGPSYVDTLGRTWLADTGFNTGKSSTDSATVTGTTDPQLFKTLRFDEVASPELTYTFPLPNGPYQVRLYMAETASSGKGTGLRVFDIDIQSVRAFDDVDIFTLAGGANKALILEAPATVFDGQLQITFLHQTNNPRVHAIEIIPVQTADTEPPTQPGTLTFTDVTTGSVTVNWGAAMDNVAVTDYRISRDGAVLATVSGLSYTDTAVAPGTAYTYSVVALDAAGNASPARAGNVSTPPSGGDPGTTVRVNAGGPQYTDGAGNVWSADTGYNTGKSSTENVTVTGTPDPFLFRTNRFDEPATPELRYTFAVANGTYVVRLHFAETYGPNKAPGKRVFDIDIQSVRAFDDVDIFVLAGAGNKALVLEAPATVSDGQLTIDLLHQVGNTRVNAIEIIPNTSTPPTDNQPPTAPGALSFTDVTASSVTVNWTAATDNVGVTGYRVSRDGAIMTTITDLSFTDTGLTAATEYVYSVVALDAAGNVSPASAADITTSSDSPADTEPPTAPGALSFTDVTSSSVTVNWDAASDNIGVTGYRVSRDGEIVTTVTDLSFTDTGLTAATEYAYSVVALDAAGNVSPASAADITTSSDSPADTEPPTAPGALSFTDVTASSVTVNWTAATDNIGVTGYRVSRDGEIVTTVTDLSFTDTGLSAATEYAYSVVALDVAGNVSPASAADITTSSDSPADTEPPTAPGALSFTDVTASSVTVNWTAATDNIGVTGYEVYRDAEFITTVTVLSYTDSSLAASTTYTYSIVAIDAADNGSTPTSASVATTGGALPSLRINAGGPAHMDTQGRTWSADTGYNTGSASTESVTVTGTSDPFLFRTNRWDAAPLPELMYAFNVPNGAYTVRLYFAETYGPNKAPGKRVFDIDIQSQRVFEDVDIFLRAGAGNRALVLESVAQVSNGQLAIAFLHQVNNPRVNAIEIVPASGGPADTQPPSAPGSLAFTDVGSNSVTINWTAATDDTGVTGYRISRDGVVITTVPGLSFTDSPLNPATTYTYAVEALDAAHNASAPSTASIATSSGGPILPTIRINTGGGSYVDTNGNTWSADTGYNTGSTYAVTTTVANTTEPALFRTERFDREDAPELTYAFGVPNGSYLVRLYFAEVYSGTQGAGLRIFDVDLEAVRAFEDVDIFVESGGANRALMREHTVTVSDGQLNIDFLHQVQNPKVNAIEILPAP